MTDALQRLIDIEEIKQLRARYSRVLDARDWTTFGEAWTPDAIQDLRSYADLKEVPEALERTTNKEGLNIGPSEIVRWVSWLMGDSTTVHHCVMPEIEITSPTTALGTWALTFYMKFPTQTDAEAARGTGYYYLEEYQKLDGTWLISRSTISNAKLTGTRNPATP